MGTENRTGAAAARSVSRRSAGEECVPHIISAPTACLLTEEFLPLDCVRNPIELYRVRFEKSTETERARILEVLTFPVPYGR